MCAYSIYNMLDVYGLFPMPERKADIFHNFYGLFWASQVALNPPANAGDLRDVCLIPWSGRSPVGGHDNPLQYSCLENPMYRKPGGLQSMGSKSVRHY